MEIIPAIDIMDGNCVRLSKGDYDEKKIYSANPLDVAKSFEAAGFKRLHLVDLDGAKAGTVINWEVLEQITKNTKLLVDFSGGLSTTENVERCFTSGAVYAGIGSIAVKNKNLLEHWLAYFGSEKFILGADVKNEKIAIKGWTEQTELDLFDFIESYIHAGIKQFICTDIDKDGLLQGPSVALYQKIIQNFTKIDLIASGGVSNIEDLKQLEKVGCSGAIVGKAIYENKILLNDLYETFQSI